MDSNPPLRKSIDPESLDPAFEIASLYSGLQISLATSLGGPITGLILVQKNFLELREFVKARHTLFFGSGLILAYYAALALLSFRFYGLSFLGYTILIPPLILESILLVFQRGKIRRFMAGGAARKPFPAAGKYVLFGLVAQGVLVFLAGAALPSMRGPKIKVGLLHHEVYYQDLDPGEVLHLAQRLELLGYLRGPNRIHLKLQKWKTGARLFFPVERAAADDLETLAYYSALIRELNVLEGRKFRGCFADDPYRLRDTLCFGEAGATLLIPIWNNLLPDSKAVLAKVEAETDFFIALFSEAEAKAKPHVTWERIPTIYGFAGNGVGTANYNAIEDALVHSYGNRENAELAIRILGNAFHGIKPTEEKSVYRLYLEILRQVRKNLELMKADS